jgi:hypothetical protein
MYIIGVTLERLIYGKKRSSHKDKLDFVLLSPQFLITSHQLSSLPPVITSLSSCVSYSLNKGQDSGLLDAECLDQSLMKSQRRPC